MFSIYDDGWTDFPPDPITLLVSPNGKGKVLGGGQRLGTYGEMLGVRGGGGRRGGEVR